jgi:uncharacterized protein with HEPN domain
MVKPTLPDRFAHILDAIEQVERRTGALDLDAFRNDRFLQLGIERCLEIISEATRHIPADLKEQHPGIRGGASPTLAHSIRHSYHAIDSEIIWLIAREELGELKAVIVGMQEGA